MSVRSGATPPRSAAWLVTARSVRASMRADRSSLYAAGVAFYLFLSMAPALAAVVSLYGLVAAPEDVDEHVRRAFSVLPSDARQVLTSQLTRIAGASAGSLGGSLLVAITAALWSASRGVAHLFDAIAMAYGTRLGAIGRRVVALTYTVSVVAAVGVVATLATLLPEPGRDSALLWILRIGLWIGSAVLALAGLELMYRLSSPRERHQRTVVAPGSLVSLALLLLVTVGLNVYVAHFGSYNASYGALAGVVVLMLWLHLAALIVILGAHVDAQM